MPPKKTKKEQVGGEQASDLVLEYLRKQNRPYSIIEIVANLHDTVSKTNLTKILKDLVERDLVKEKVSGKQAIYHIVQDPNDAATPEELKEMDAMLEKLKEEITNLKAEKKAWEAELNTLKAAPSSESLRESIKTLNKEIKQLMAHLAPLRAGTLPPVSPAEKAAIDAEFSKYETMLKSRRKMFDNFWGYISDNSGQNKNELWVSMSEEIRILSM
ncbi:Tat binding protein 1-interacting protein-domain-containing protein [Peziza echinospora]|nr:Tat binding protein 1-interacting protein-domain-containing protein [Peziza echinospora]